MLPTLEPGPGLAVALHQIPRHLNLHNPRSSGLVAGIFNLGPLLFFVELLRQAGQPSEVIEAWVSPGFLG